jgi:hypothetical protein
MDKAAIDAWTRRSRTDDLEDLPWERLRERPLGSGAVRVLRYMQDIEAHTVVYVRQLLATRAIDDEDVAAFLAGWFHDETLHGRALARVLAASGRPVRHRPRSRMPLARHAEEWAMGAIGRVWGDFLAVHMGWGAVNELTALAGYQLLANREPHPTLVPLLHRIACDETRHFGFYYQQAERRLASAGARRVARWLVDRFWAPVGSGVQPEGEVRFLARFLFADAAGRAAARRVDATIRRLPGFADVRLLDAWVDRLAGEGAQPIPNAPSNTRRRRVQGSVQASRATAVTAAGGNAPSTAAHPVEGVPNAAAIRSA